MMRYLLNHWRGRQSLAWSFWVNLVAVRVCLFLLQDVLLAREGVSLVDAEAFTYLTVFILHALLLIWQVVGVVRAGDNHFATNHNMAFLWGSQLGSVVFFFLSAAYALEAVQLTFPKVDEQVAFDKISADRKLNYNVSVLDDNSILLINGSIELGMTKVVKESFVNNADISTVQLNSGGGNIYEARGLAKLFADNDIATHVDTQCASACTLAFIGGVRRTASKHAEFGFHQYKVDADYTILATDVAKEQQHDKALFVAAGVSDFFVNSMYSHEASAMWWPSMQELLNAKVVHEVR